MQTILYPLIIWGVFHITLQLIFADYVNVHRYPSDYFRLLYKPRTVEQFWYLNALFFVALLYMLVSVYARFNTIQQLILGIVLYAISGYLHMNNIEAGFITDVFFFYLFFAVGDAVSHQMLDPRSFKRIASYKTLLMILPVFILIQHYFTYLNLSNKNDYYVQNYQPALFAIAAVIGGSFVIIVSFLLQKANKLRFLRVVGYHSLFIYVANLMVTAASRVIMTRIFHIDSVEILMTVCVIAGIVVPIIFYNIMVRMGAYWLFTLRKPSDEIKLEAPRVSNTPVISARLRKSMDQEKSTHQ